MVPANDVKGRKTRIMLAKKLGAQAKFLCEVAPLSESPNDKDLPCEVTLEGYTRQEWGMVNNSDTRDWKTQHFVCVDDKRYLQGRLCWTSKRLKLDSLSVKHTFVVCNFCLVLHHFSVRSDSC
uniref:Uncharacterized protein n=1 Tax=Odontella aurita TaxID=265563 RepID=A0A6U6CW85_9STRA|mmetsp:Transcript_16148/g.46584  ORF Transcript_16148/g.46584 Transcript_16148/m.46584 type:complete len:123 (+) Transcript_16148:289-657(+)